MTKRELTLSKMMMIYSYLYCTTKPNKTVMKATTKLKKAFRVIFNSEKDMFKKCEDHQKDIYKKAWRKAFGNEEQTKYIDLGYFILMIYETVDKKISNKWIGEKQMEKVIDSYFMANPERKQDEYEIEETTRKITDEVLKLYGIEPKSNFATKAKILKDNLILEGKL